MDEKTLGRKLIEWAAKSLNVSCYDREDYGYCVFCNEEQPAWDVGIKHAPDCLHVQARALLARRIKAGSEAVIIKPALAAEDQWHRLPATSEPGEQMKNTTNWTKLYAPRQNDAGKWETRVTDANDKLLAVVEHDTEQEARDWQLRAMMGELGGLLKAAEDDTDDN